MSNNSVSAEIPSVTDTDGWTGWYTSTSDLGQPDTGFLLGYHVICTVLTITLNAFLIWLILFKIKLRRHISAIPVFCASLLGLFHGLGYNLLAMISFARGDWPGAMDWCGISALLDIYTIYCIVYCSIVVLLEAAYLISNPLSYDREGKRALVSICCGTATAILILLPITILQFSYLKPNEIKEIYSEAFSKYGDKFYIYLSKSKKCVRFSYPGTFDYRFNMYFTFSTNILAFFLEILSFGTIFKVAAKSSQFRKSQQQLQQQERDSKISKIVKAAVLMASLTTLPWLPNFILSFLASTKLRELGIFWTIVGVSNNINLVLTWVFPLMNMFFNPDISRALNNVIRRVRSSIGTQQTSSVNVPH